MQVASRVVEPLKTDDLRELENTRELSKPDRMIVSPSPPAKSNLRQY